MSRHAAFALLCGALLAGCGSTVQGQSTVQSGLPTTDRGSSSLSSGDAGLGAPPAASYPSAQGTSTNPTAGLPPGATSVVQPGNPGGGSGSIPTAGATGAPKPISIGFYNTNNAQINSEYGYSVPQGEDIDRALVTAINAHGGLAGHKVVAHFVTYSADSHSYASDAAAACQTFTVDTPVSIVISPTVSTEYGFADCMQRKGVLLESGWWTDARSFADHSLLFSAAGSTFERGYITALDRLHASGYLTAKNHLGVFLEGCPDDVRAWTGGIRPEIERLGIRTELSTLSCTAGIQDAGAASAAINSAILKWQSAGVDRVMFVSSYESTLLVLFAPSAESQHFHPGYVLTSNAGASGVLGGGSFPAGQRSGLRGAGTLPGFDVDRPPQPSAVESRCLALARSAGVQMQSSFDREILYNHCASLFLFEAALTVTSPAPTNDEIRAAIEGLGTQVQLPGLVDDRAHLDANRRDAPAYAREFGWQAGCSCLTYLGAAAPMS
jgi:hypothetical protein